MNTPENGLDTSWKKAMRYFVVLLVDDLYKSVLEPSGRK